MLRLQNRVALITGGTAGIGQATAALFTREGARVVITGRSSTRGAQVVAAGEAAHFIACDVRDPAACARAVQETAARFGRLDVLFNNAGIVPMGTLPDTPLDVWRDVWETNVTGTFATCKAALPLMIGQGGGVIVNNASDWGIVGGQGAAAYCATKGAVVLLTKALALDHARQGIRVNAVCPGDTFVERWRARHESDAALHAQVQADGAQFPLGRVAQVDEIARAVLFLACDDSSYVTGHTLIVDGGHTAGGTSVRYEESPDAP